MKIINTIFKIVRILTILCIIGGLMWLIHDGYDAHNILIRGYKQGQEQGYDSAMKQRIHIIVDSTK